MDVAIDKQQRRATVAVSGEIDSETSPQLQSSLLQLAAGDVEEISVDVAGVTFISSAGLGALISAHQRLHEKGGRLLLGRGNRIVDRVVALTGLEHLYGPN